jgi:menaquinone-dependent protoporphyrinogen oxidase
MVVWVTVASKYGATREVADAIAEELRRSHDVRLRDAEEADGFDDAGAVVLGSAVYAGHWLEPARKLLEERSERLLVSALRAPEGDFRDWDAIRAWGGRIGGELAS